MNFFLKILNEVRSRDRLKVDGRSGMLYRFMWDRKLRAYIYHPGSQEEVDDLFATMGRTTSYKFCPVNVPAAHSVKVIVHDPLPPIDLRTGDVHLEPGDTPKATLDDKLVEMCLFRGVVVTDEDTNETAKRLIASYDKGATDSLNSLPAVKKRTPRKPKAPKEPKPPA